MKRVIVILLAVLLLPMAAVAAAVAVTFMSRQGVVDGFDAGDVRIIQDGMGVTVAIVPVSARRVVLIDAGNDKSAEPVLKELTRRGLDRDSVAAILLTHGHPDHTAGISQFPKADVMALEADAGLIEGRDSARGPLPRLMPRSASGKVTRALHDGETITIDDGEIKVYAVPGHTQGSAAYLTHGVLFIGDAADLDRSGRLIGAPWIFSDDQAQDRASLVRLARRLAADRVDVRTIAFAHSGVRTDGLAPLAAFAADEKP